MGWWPFRRREKPLTDDPHIKGTRVWLTELREMCEQHFDNHAEGQRRIANYKLNGKKRTEKLKSMLNYYRD